MPRKGARGFAVDECTMIRCSKEWVKAVIVWAYIHRKKGDCRAMGGCC